MTELRFFVPGIPSPGGSKRAFGIKKGGVYTGRVAIVDAAGEKTKHWRASVGEAAFKARGERISPLSGPLELELIFQMPRPKGHFRKDGVSLRPGAPRFHVTRPDAGKLARSTTDACKGILWLDDSQIVKETHEKFYTNTPGCWIILRQCETEANHAVTDK